MDRAPYVHPFYQCSAELIGYPAHTIYNILIGIVLIPDLVIILSGGVLSSLCYFISLVLSIILLLCRRIYLVHVDYNNNAATPVNVRVCT